MFLSNFLNLSDEIQPYCTQTGCVCPHGYNMIEYAFKAVCRPEEPTDDPEPGKFLLNLLKLFCFELIQQS
jgi:hypothetical protein